MHVRSLQNSAGHCSRQRIWVFSKSFGKRLMFWVILSHFPKNAVSYNSAINSVLWQCPRSLRKATAREGTPKPLQGQGAHTRALVGGTVGGWLFQGTCASHHLSVVTQCSAWCQGVKGEMNKSIDTAENSWVGADDNRCKSVSLPQQVDVRTGTSDTARSLCLFCARSGQQTLSWTCRPPLHGTSDPHT